MDSEKNSPKKTKRFAKNLQAKECVRPFKLRGHFPSTLTELKKNGIDNSTIQGKTVSNIISALPLADSMKFIPNKEVQPSEVQNVQKLKFKSVNGKDLVVYNVTKKNSPHTRTVPKIIQKSNNLRRLESLRKSTQGQTAKVENVTEVVAGSSISEQSKEDKLPPRTTIKIINNDKKLSLDTAQSSDIPIIVQSTSSDALKKIVTPNIMITQSPNIINTCNVISTQPSQPRVVTVKKVVSYPKVVMVQKGSNQIVSPGVEKYKQFNLMRKTLMNNQVIKKNDEKIVIQTQLSNSFVKKRDSSCLDQINSSQIKKVCRDIQTQDSQTNEDSLKEACNTEISKSSETEGSSQTLNAVATQQNIMVVVPHDAEKILSMAANSLDTYNEDDVIDDSNGPLVLREEDLIDSYDNNQDIESSNTEKVISSPTKEKTDLSDNQHTDNSNLENLELDQLSILEKAVLSVQDDNLRAKALKALKDCGIKAKKKVFIKKNLPSKIIVESAVQTNVFSLLQEGEFLEADEQYENLIKIKSSRKTQMKSTSTLENMPRSENGDYINEWKKDMDDMIVNLFPTLKPVSDFKDAFVQDKKLKAEYMLKKLLKDFEAAKIHDADGYLGIHKAVANNSLQEVQKHITVLRATKQSIDVCTQDGQTSLELAVELEVDPQIIKVLLDSGAQPVSTKPIHDSAIILAAKKFPRLLPMLVKYINRSQKKLINAKNLEGMAAIHYCAQLGNLEGISELIKHGADVNLQDERSGRTALFYALDTKSNDVSQEVYYEIAQKLVDNGAFSNIPTFSKHSVLSLIDDVKSHALKIALNRAVK